jgi:NAD dependent epimerase/dehydratase family enzyme/ligand-binding SRPBCC domain-containing protein
MPRFQLSSELPYPPEVVAAWHRRPGALHRLTPPWQRVEVLRHEGVHDGARAELRIASGPLRFRWIARHRTLPDGFCDEQESGPFAAWSHAHRFLAAPGGCRMSDEIDWSPACWMPTHVIEHDLARAFAWRHRRLREDLARHAATALAPLRIALSGASGLVGREIAAFLDSGGHTVVPISRRGGGIAWDGHEQFDAAALRGCDAVIHLAGAGIGDRRWSAARKAEIRSSRVVGTAALARLLAEDPGRVRTLITASGVGFYGSRGESVLDETTSSGDGFLADVCRAWESAVDPCRNVVRTVQLRIGVVLSGRGGALASMLPAARAGMGGALGDGRQWWSWIALDDLVHVPSAIRQADFARTLAAALGRPAWGPPAPRALLRLALGGMADEALLASTRADPAALRTNGFAWAYPELAGTLTTELGRQT